MSRGELFVEDNQVKESSVSAVGDWADEYQNQHVAGPSWAEQFPHEVSLKF